MNKLDNYSILAAIYDHLMQEVDYREWALYLKYLIRQYKKRSKHVLELAGGTGKLGSHLFNVGKFYHLTDLSPQLLNQSPNKFTSKICCDMRYIPYTNKSVDVVLCSFDSINYILTDSDLIKVFNEVERVLTEDGIFLFDVSLKHNSINNIDLLNREGEYHGYHYKQISIYKPELNLHTNEFHISYNNEEFSELHVQKVYDLFDIFELLDKAGLEVVECYDSFSLERATPDNERAQFVVSRIQ